MRKSRLTDAQIVAIVREGGREGVTVEQCAKKHGITPMTLFRRRKRFGGALSDAQLLGGLAFSTAAFALVAERLFRAFENRAHALGRLDQTTLF